MILVVCTGTSERAVKVKERKMMMYLSRDWDVLVDYESSHDVSDTDERGGNMGM